MNTAQPYLIVLFTGLISMATPAAAQTTTGETAAVQLTLADAEARALDRNPTLAQARLGTELADYSILQSRTAYTPTFSTSFEQRSQTMAGTSQLTGGAQVVTDNTSYQSGIAQLFPWGSRVSVDFTSGRNASNNVFSTVNRPRRSPPFGGRIGNWSMRAMPSRTPAGRRRSRNGSSRRIACGRRSARWHRLMCCSLKRRWHPGCRPACWRRAAGVPRWSR